MIFFNFDFEKKQVFLKILRKPSNLFPPRLSKLESSVFHSTQYTPFPNFEFRHRFFVMFENVRNHSSRNVWPKIMHKKAWGRHSKFWFWRL